MHRDAPWTRIGANNRHRRHALPAARTRQIEEFRGNAVLGAGVDAHRAEQRAQRVVLDAMHVSPDVVILRRDAVGRSKALQRFAHALRPRMKAAP